MFGWPGPLCFFQGSGHWMYYVDATSHLARFRNGDRWVGQGTKNHGLHMWFNYDLDRVGWLVRSNLLVVSCGKRSRGGLWKWIEVRHPIRTGRSCMLQVIVWCEGVCLWNELLYRSLVGQSTIVGRVSKIIIHSLISCFVVTKVHVVLSTFVVLTWMRGNTSLV